MALIEEILGVLAPGWVGSLIGLGGIVAAAIIYVLTRQRSILAYRTLGDRLLGHTEAKLPDEVTVQYRGRSIPRLTRSLIVLWNAGEKTIEGKDIVGADPLRVEVSADAEILAASVLKCSRDVTGIRVNTLGDQSNAATITFDFIDRGDGAVLEVLHSSERRHLSLLGTIRGIPNGPKDLGRMISRHIVVGSFPSKMPLRLLCAITTIAGIAIGLFGLLFPVSETTVPGLPELRVLLVLAGFLYVGFGLFLFWVLRRRYPRALQIDDLE